MFFLFCIDGVPRMIVAGGKLILILFVFSRKALYEEVWLPLSAISV